MRYYQKNIGNQYLLEKNIIIKNNQELINDPIKFLLVDQPNKKIFGIPFKRNLYNLSVSNSDSVFNDWLNRKEKRKKRLDNWLSPKQVKELRRYKSGFNNWLKENGEAPVFLDTVSSQKSVNRLKQFHKNQGYFDTEVISKTILETENKSTVQYFIDTGEQYTIDSVSKKINSQALDSLYELSMAESLIQKGNPFEIDRFEAERTRLINFLEITVFTIFSKTAFSSQQQLTVVV